LAAEWVLVEPGKEKKGKQQKIQDKKETSMHQITNLPNSRGGEKKNEKMELTEQGGGEGGIYYRRKKG